MNNIYMASEEYLKVLNEFYKLKHLYESTYKNKINTLKKTKNRNELHNAIKKIKRKCVACKKSGGTIFTTNDNTLKAVCGNVDNPCNLHIELQKGYIVHQDNFLKNIEESIELNKKNIISTKLSLLFGLEEEDISMKLFEDYKNDLSEALEQMQFWEEKQHKNNSVTIKLPEGTDLEEYNSKKITITDETKYEEVDVEKKIYLQKKEQELEGYISDLNNNILEFRKDNTKKNMLKDSFIDYSNNVINTLNEIRKIKYDSLQVIKEKMYTIPNTSATIYKYIVAKTPISISNKEIIINDYQVISKTYI
jgi:hypothetical protein